MSLLEPKIEAWAAGTGRQTMQALTQRVFLSNVTFPFECSYQPYEAIRRAKSRPISEPERRKTTENPA